MLPRRHCFHKWKITLPKLIFFFFVVPSSLFSQVWLSGTSCDLFLFSKCHQVKYPWAALLLSFSSFCCSISVTIHILLLTLSVALLPQPPQCTLPMLTLFRNIRVLFCPIACLHPSVILCIVLSCLGSHSNHLCINLTQILEGLCSSWQLYMLDVSSLLEKVDCYVPGKRPKAPGSHQPEKWNPYILGKEILGAKSKLVLEWLCWSVFEAESEVFTSMQFMFHLLRQNLR